jgi:hypothetical protein
MSTRIPPRIATWLLERLGPGYRNESLVGDLFEEYQLGHTRAWYWHQAVVATWIGGTVRLRRALQHLASSALLRVLTEAAGLLGVLALSQQFRHACVASGTLPDLLSIVALLAAIGLCVSFGLYWSLSTKFRFRRATAARSGTSIRRLMSVFALTALSAGTLAWAGAAQRTPQRCTIPLTASSPSTPGYAQDYVHSHRQVAGTRTSMGTDLP